MKEYISDEEFADFVKFMRQSIDLTKRSFADAVGVSLNTINNWEGCIKYPKDVYLVIENIRNVVKYRIRNNRKCA